MPVDYIAALEKRKAHDKFTAWVTEQNSKIPELANRIFGLRNSSFLGSVRYDLEKDLGICMARLNDRTLETYYNGPNAGNNQSVLQVILEGLYERVADAEQSAEKPASRP